MARSNRQETTVDQRLTAVQVGELLGGIPTRSVYHYAREGLLPSVRIGKHVRFHPDDVQKAVLDLRGGG